MQTPGIWHIPQQRNRFFTGREDVLAQLHDALKADATAALSHPQGISGLGGIGKTQTALEYAYRYQNDYTAVFWIRADSIAALTSSMIELAHVLELPERDKRDQEIIIEAVLRWLRLHSGWLLIYDNIDDFSIAEPFLPKAEAGHLLFTTRAHALGKLAQRLDIQKMEPETGALLLLRRAHLLALQIPLKNANLEDQAMAQAISQELDGLPLALDQAGAYIKEAPCTLSEYLVFYQTQRDILLRERGSIDQGYPTSIATTWSLSFEKVRHANLASTELLNFCAFLAPDTISTTMIAQGAQHLPLILQNAVMHPLQYDQTIATLLAYSLIGRNEHEKLSIHRLVQTILQNTLAEHEQEIWTEQTVAVLNTVFPNLEDYTTWNQCEELLPHILIRSRGMLQNEPLALLLARTIHYLLLRAQPMQAEPLARQVLRIREQILGPEHIEVADALNRLAETCREQNKYAEAEPLYQRALLLAERDNSHELLTATILNNLAICLKMRRKYTEAERYYQQAIKQYTKIYGPDHPRVAEVHANLGILYSQVLGRSIEAEQSLKEALRIQENVLESDHPSIAYTLSELALLSFKLGKEVEAESLYLRAKHIREQTLGPDHPLLATILNNLADVYREQKRYLEAESLYLRALEIQEKNWGSVHLEIVPPLWGLAAFYRQQKKYIEAQQHILRARRIAEQILEPNHPYVAESLNILANLHFDQQQYREAEQFYRQSVNIHQLVSGPDSLNVSYPLQGLAYLYLGQERYAEAKILFLQVLHIWEQARGFNHPSLADLLDNLASCCSAQGELVEAEHFSERARSIRAHVPESS